MEVDVDKEEPMSKTGLEKLMMDLGMTDQEMSEEQFNEMVTVLNPQQEQALRERYGIPKPRQDSSEGSRITAEHIRQIEREALRRLRSRK